MTQPQPPQGESRTDKNLDILIAERKREILDPAKAGLLIVDMQVDFVMPEGKSATLWNQDISRMHALIPGIDALAKLFRQHGRPVIWTKTYEDPELRTLAGKDRFLFFEGNDREGEVACLKGTPGAELAMRPEPQDIVIEKERMSAYINTPLHEIIGNLGIGTMFEVGTKTQRCVTRVLHDLYENEPELHVVLLEDLVASDNLAAHEAALAELRTFYPPVMTSGEVFEDWASRAA